MIIPINLRHLVYEEVFFNFLADDEVVWEGGEDDLLYFMCIHGYRGLISALSPRRESQKMMILPPTQDLSLFPLNHPTPTLKTEKHKTPHTQFPKLVLPLSLYVHV